MHKFSPTALDAVYFSGDGSAADFFFTSEESADIKIRFTLPFGLSRAQMSRALREIDLAKNQARSDSSSSAVRAHIDELSKKNDLCDLLVRAVEQVRPEVLSKVPRWLIDLSLAKAICSLAEAENQLSRAKQKLLEAQASQKRYEDLINDLKQAQAAIKE